MKKLVLLNQVCIHYLLQASNKKPQVVLKAFEGRVDETASHAEDQRCNSLTQRNDHFKVNARAREKGER